VRRASRLSSKFIKGAHRLAAEVRKIDGIDGKPRWWNAILRKKTLFATVKTVGHVSKNSSLAFRMWVPLEQRYFKQYHWLRGIPSKK